MKDDSKKKIAYIIEYERNKRYKETGSKEFAKETFPTMIVRHQQVNICSSTTYRKLVNLEIIKNDDIYDLLLAKLDLYCDENAYVYTSDFAKQCQKLLDTIELGTLSLATTQCEKMLNMIQNKEVIEKQYYHALVALKEMTSTGRMLCSNEQMKPIADMFAIYNDAIKQCLEIAMYNYCVSTQQDHKIQEYFALIPKTPYHRIHVLYYHIDANYQLDYVKDEVAFLLDHYQNNANQTLNILIMKMKYYYWIGKDSDIAMQQIDDFIRLHENEIEDSEISSYWYFKAKKYNREKKYEQAKDWFEKLLQKDTGYISYVMSYYFHTLVMLDERVRYDQNIGEKLNLVDQKIYQYFQIDKEDYIAREQYIMKVLCDDPMFMQEYNTKSFLYELRKVVRKTKHYVLLDKFLEMTDDFY